MTRVQTNTAINDAMTIIENMLSNGELTNYERDRLDAILTDMHDLSTLLRYPLALANELEANANDNN